MKGLSPNRSKMKSLIDEISSHIKSSRDDAVHAESQLWNLLHTRPELLDRGAQHDLANVAENLSAASRQMEAHIETLGRLH